MNQKRIIENDATRVGVEDVLGCEPWNPVGIQTGARTSVRFHVRGREAWKISVALGIRELKRRERRALILFRARWEEIGKITRGGVRRETEAERAFGGIGKHKSAGQQFARDGLACARRDADDAGHVAT